jgi:hypothetical protein
MKHHKQKKTNKGKEKKLELEFFLKKVELEITWSFKLLFPHLHKVRRRGVGEGTNLKSMNQNGDKTNKNKILKKTI